MKFFLFIILLIFGSVMMSAAQCVCPFNHDPVCGTNGQTYSNTCLMRCSGGKLAHKVFTLLLILGSAIMSAAQCFCTANYEPVCGTNGQTYSNTCQMTCSGGKLAHKGEC